VSIVEVPAHDFLRANWMVLQLFGLPTPAVHSHSREGKQLPRLLPLKSKQ
jgi:hypothetical protein